MVSNSWSSAHHRGMGNGGHPGDMSRRMRNRTLTGLETMQRMGGGIGHNPGGGLEHLRPGSASGRPITPSFSNDKEPGQTFIDFNPAGMYIYIFTHSIRYAKIFILDYINEPKLLNIE